MKCLECDHARKTKNEGYVGCSYWLHQLGNADVSEEQFAQRIFAQEPTISNLALGWAFPYRRPESEGDGTATSGLMWNGFYCVPKDDYCSKFESR